MKRTLLILCCASCLSSGCLSRAIREGTGVVRGASGRVVVLRHAGDLSRYTALRVGSCTTTPGLPAPANLGSLLTEAFYDTARDLQLSGEGSPALLVEAEVLHYERGEILDHATGPLQEMIVRTRLLDADSRQLLGEANLVGRAKSLTAAGRRNLADGVGKALKEWLEDAGLEVTDDI